MIPRRAIAADLDALADAWEWTATDRLVHALPLFHVHGLVLGVLGPLRVGSPLQHLPAFAPAPGGTLYFAVPTMWSRVRRPRGVPVRAAAGLGIGGAARPVFDRFAGRCGHRIAERYGLTETLINTAARADGERRPGAASARPSPGCRSASSARTSSAPSRCAVPTSSPATSGTTPATAAAMTPDGWFKTGDLGALDPDGQLRIVGRQSTDLIKSGGYKIGAGEIENALLAHPAVAETAVIGVPDDDLGERVVAYVVAREPVAPDDSDRPGGRQPRAAQAAARDPFRRGTPPQRHGQGAEEAARVIRLPGSPHPAPVAAS